MLQNTNSDYQHICYLRRLIGRVDNVNASTIGSAIFQTFSRNLTVFSGCLPHSMLKITSFVGSLFGPALWHGQFFRNVERLCYCKGAANVSHPTVRPSCTFKTVGLCDLSVSSCSNISVRCYAKSKDKKSNKGTPLSRIVSFIPRCFFICLDKCLNTYNYQMYI